MPALVQEEKERRIRKTETLAQTDGASIPARQNKVSADRFHWYAMLKPFQEGQPIYQRLIIVILPGWEAWTCGELKYSEQKYNVSTRWAVRPGWFIEDKVFNCLAVPVSNYNITRQSLIFRSPFPNSASRRKLRQPVILSKGALNASQKARQQTAPLPALRPLYFRSFGARTGKPALLTPCLHLFLCSLPPLSSTSSFARQLQPWKLSRQWAHSAQMKQVKTA